MSVPLWLFQVTHTRWFLERNNYTRDLTLPWRLYCLNASGELLFEETSTGLDERLDSPTCESYTAWRLKRLKSSENPPLTHLSSRAACLLRNPWDTTAALTCLFACWCYSHQFTKAANNILAANSAHTLILKRWLNGGLLIFSASYDPILYFNSRTKPSAKKKTPVPI